MPMYKLTKYSKNYKNITSSLWNYYRKEPNIAPADSYNADPARNSTLFKYISSIIGKTLNNDNDDNSTKDNEIVVPLKYLSKSLEDARYAIY